MTTRYIGLNAHTGAQISDLDHIKQSISKILLTPIGSRVMRRDFGSLIPELIDQPLNGKTHIQLMAAGAMAINAWEPRIDLTSITLQAGSAPSSLVAHLVFSRRDGPSAGTTEKLQVTLRG